MSNSITQAMKDAREACQKRSVRLAATFLEPKPVRRSARLAEKKAPDQAKVPTLTLTPTPTNQTSLTTKQLWNTDSVQDIQTLMAFPTYRELFRKYNLPISFINRERDHLTLESCLTHTMQGTDYTAAIHTYCFFMRGRSAMNNAIMLSMLKAMGLKDCVTYAMTSIAPEKPTYDTKTHRIQFEHTRFDPKWVALFVKAPEFNSQEVQEARKTPVAPLRKSSFNSSMRVFLDKMDIIVANKAKYPSTKEYMDAKVQNVQNLYNQLLLMQDILVGEDSLRRFTLVTEIKAFEIIAEICNHPEINPMLAAETLFVLRSYIVMVRALMSALED